MNEGPTWSEFFAMLKAWLPQWTTAEWLALIILGILYQILIVLMRIDKRVMSVARMLYRKNYPEDREPFED